MASGYKVWTVAGNDMFQEAVRKYKAEVVRQFETNCLEIAEKLRYSHRQALNIIREFPQSV